MLRFVRPWKIIYFPNKHFSNYIGEVKHEIKSDEFLQGCINYDFKLCELKLDELNLKLDMIEFRPYEKFFHQDLIINSIKSEVVDKSKISFDPKHINILNGLNLLKGETSLPRKISEVINILTLKMAQLYPNYEIYKKCSKNEYKIAYDFASSAYTNTIKNATYMDVCIQKGDYEKAFNLMKQIRTDNNSLMAIQKKNLIVDSIFYEPAINVLGKKAKLEFIIKLLNEMDELKILPSVPIIFRSFEAASKKNVFDIKVISRFRDYIARHGLSLEDAFLKAPITKENFQHILKAIQVVEPEFKLVSKNSEIKNKSILKNTCIHSNMEELEKYFDSQLINEQLTCVSLDPVYKFTVDKTLLTKLKLVEDKWRNSLMESFEKKVALLVYSDRSKLYPYLSVLPPKSYVDAMIQMVYQLTTDNCLQFSNIRNVYLMIGDIIHNMFRYRCLKKQKHFTQLKSICLSYFDKLSTNPQNDKLDSLWRQSVFENIENGNVGTGIIEWEQTLKTDIGRILYEIMFENMTFVFVSNGQQVTSPVIYEQMEEDATGVFISVKVQSKLKTMLKSVDKALPNFSQLEMPMLHPPIPFHSNYHTSFLYLTNYATRMIRQASQVQLYNNDLIQPYDIGQVYNALNILGLCSWKIDNENLDLVSKIFNDNGNMSLKIPLFSTKIEKPEKWDSKTGEYREKWKNQKLQSIYQQEKKEMYSLWSTVFYKISIAKKFRNKRLWFPYSMDFRSRVYPCSPHLNHIGDDVSRGLLKFSYGKKLGPKGLDWIKIHLINLCGTHKRSSNEDRLKAANENLSNIINSARDPLKTGNWWQKSEKPWQTLLVCREIYNIIKFAEQNQGCTDEFVSTLPVHQDGSCNGLQHYAALGKDAEGAKAVNLINSNAPQDVYSDVLEHVERKRSLDASQGVKEAIELEGLVSRKVIKQSVMTTVYGVTQFGAKEQIHKQLKELNKLPSDALFRCSVYLSKVTLNSIGEIFSSASQIQNWFVEMAAQISKLRKSNISWVTPMNLVVTQPYFHSGSDPMKPDVMKNRNAFPPNFVHSLDSSHMMMTAIRCWQENITFVSVHDCFWTHACDVDAMNKICREEFVKLHSQPVLENLSLYLYEKYGFHKITKELTKHQIKFNDLLKKIPKKGTFDINEVINSTYFFS